MANNFANKLISLQKEVEAIKAAKIRAAGVLRVGTWTGSLHFDIVNYTPQKTARITITPTMAGENILTSIGYTGSWNNNYFRILRNTGSGDAVIYYVHYTKDTALSSDKSFDMPIAINYTHPCTIAVDYVNNIFGY